MSTLIQLKRKASTGNGNVSLLVGEPYYNLTDKKLYIGDSTTSSDIPASKKHVAQITALTPANSASIKFQVGENPNNIYERTITAEDLTGTIASAANVTTSIGGVGLSTLFEMSSGKPIYAKKATTAISADSATTATYAADDKTKTIGQRFAGVQDTVNAAETRIMNKLDTILNTENWRFVYETGTAVTKRVYVGCLGKARWKFRLTDGRVVEKEVYAHDVS